MSKPNTYKYINSVAALFFTGLIVLSTGCAEEAKRTTDQETEEKEVLENKNSNMLKINGKIFSIPSPIQTAYFIKEVGAEFRTSVLNSPSKVSTYTTTMKKALNLGIYGADMGYVTIYDQSQESISFMAVSKRLSAELGMGDVFDKDLVQRFEANLGNQDSLLALVSDAFKSADGYLKENKQDDISVMILVGGWIETLHFACKLYEPGKAIEIKNRIGEQKITLDNITNMLLPFEDDPEVKPILESLSKLQTIYEGITYNYIYKEPITDAENKVTRIMSESTIEMTEEQLKEISTTINEIRNSVIN